MWSSRSAAVLCFLAGCRDRAPDPVDASPAIEVIDAGTRPLRAEAHPDAGVPLDAACEGMKLALVAAALDPRCAVSDYEWLGISEAPGLTQEARREGDRIVFALANRGMKTVEVPIRFDDRHPQRAFSAVAETDGGLFALVAPTFDFTRPDASVHVHSARIRLPPGGLASATLTVDLTVDERIDRRDASAPKRLEPPLTLHLGQLLCPLDMGDPARVVR